MNGGSDRSRSGKIGGAGSLAVTDDAVAASRAHREQAGARVTPESERSRARKRFEVRPGWAVGRRRAHAPSANRPTSGARCHARSAGATSRSKPARATPPACRSGSRSRGNRSDSLARTGPARRATPQGQASRRSGPSPRPAPHSLRRHRRPRRPSRYTAVHAAHPPGRGWPREAGRRSRGRSATKRAVSRR
jgi:hypothetical protein